MKKRGKKSLIFFNCSSILGQTKGGTHVGVILSFVIFVTFLLFLYTILIEPSINQQGNKFLLDNVRLNILEEVNVENFTTKTFLIDMSGVNLGNKKCIRINENEGGGGTNVKKGGLADLDSQGIKFTIKDSSNKLINYSKLGQNNLNIGPIDSSFDGFLKINYASDYGGSPEYTGPQNCRSIFPDDYEITRESSSNEILESKITGLIDSYALNYELLREQLKISVDNEFILAFVYGNGTILEPEGEIPRNVNVYVTEILAQYIDKEGNFKLGTIIIKMW